MGNLKRVSSTHDRGYLYTMRLMLSFIPLKEKILNVKENSAKKCLTLSIPQCIYLGQEDSGLVRCFAILAGFFIFLIIVQYGTFSKHLKVLGFAFMADYYFDALDGK